MEAQLKNRLISLILQLADRQEIVAQELAQYPKIDTPELRIGKEMLMGEMNYLLGYMTALTNVVEDENLEIDENFGGTDTR